MKPNSIQTSRRFVETALIIQKHVDFQRKNKATIKIVEIGGNDASFKHMVNYSDESKWITIDKYGDPDIKTDIDGRNSSIPFPDGTVDIIVCTEVIEHLLLGSYLVKEICRALSPTGVAVISVPNIASLKSRVDLLFGRIPACAASGDCGHELGGSGYMVDGDWVGAHIVDFNFERFKHYLVRGGLEISRHYGVSITFTYKGKRVFYVSEKFIPKNFSGYILVDVKKT
jgi:SAM-dependent methyltransferase